ncbi:MAG TPA: FtsX-like permease family protein, partial [Patescibacteria group bacterium]
KDGKDYTQVLDTEGNAVVKEGYVVFENVTVENIAGSDLASQAKDITIDDLDLTTLQMLNQQSDTTSIKKTPIPKSNLRQAVVNLSMLKIIGLTENEAVGKEFGVSFIVSSNLLDNPEDRVQSEETNYKIIGVIPDNSAPHFYVPFKDLRALGIDNFSQAKVLVKNEKDLPKVRQQIEVLGFSTRSVVDTVAQINSLFSTLRVVLALLGVVALAVAALGMFNTLTVSLLERTREVGLMKSMGMKSEEIKDLFLAESLLMGTLGGIFGLIVGFIMGKIVEFGLSTFAVIKGVGFVNIVYIPVGFIILIICLSLFVGIITGLYPARRATKISALNALRYE